MPLPIWLIPIALKGAAVVAGTTGVGVAAHGAKKMKDANDTAKLPKVATKETWQDSRKRMKQQQRIWTSSES